MQDAVPLAIGFLGALLSVVFIWRGYAQLTESPPCADLTEVAGPAKDITLTRGLFSARSLEFFVERRKLYVPPSPFVLSAVHPLRSGARSVAKFCSAPLDSPARLWELSVDGRTVFDLSAWRAFSAGQSRVMGVACVLSLCLAMFGFRLSRRAV